MAALQRRHNKWRAKVRIPLPLRPAYGGKQFLQRTMVALDRPAARLEASAWELTLRTEWALKSDAGNASRAALRQLYTC